MIVISTNSITEANDMVRARKIQAGDSFLVSYIGKTYHVGERYEDHDNLCIQKIWYSPRKWWQFWKKRKILGYTVSCTK